MKVIKVLLAHALIVSMSAYADFGTFTCKSSGLNINLEVSEVSDVSLETSILKVNNKKAKITKVLATKTEYGLSSIDIQVGAGPGKYHYYFNNLGSAKCLGVYDSKQKGSAFVEVINSLGRIAKVNCECEQD